MKIPGEGSDALLDQVTREFDVLVEAITLRRQHQAVDGAQPCQDGAGLQRIEFFRVTIDHGAPRPCPAHEGSRHRDFQQAILRAEPEGVGAALAEIRAAFGSVVEGRTQRQIDVEAQLPQYVRCIGADAVAACLVDGGCDTEVRGDQITQRGNLAEFQIPGQIADEGVVTVDVFEMRWVDPGMGVGTDLAAAAAKKIHQLFASFELIGNRIVNRIAGLDGIGVEDGLHPVNLPHRRHRRGAARGAAVPIEFGLGIDDHEQLKWLAALQPDR